MKLSEVIGLEVVGASGVHRGYVFDLRCAGEAPHGEAETTRTVTEIIFARVGWLERMGIRAIHEEALPWSEVATVGTRRVMLKKG